MNYTKDSETLRLLDPRISSALYNKDTPLPAASRRVGCARRTPQPRPGGCRRNRVRAGGFSFQPRKSSNTPIGLAAFDAVRHKAKDLLVNVLVIRDALAYRLGRIEAELHVFEKKYGMTFDEYRQRWESEDRDEDYRWEAKRDYLEWEALGTLKRRLEDVYSWLS